MRFKLLRIGALGALVAAACAAPAVAQNGGEDKVKFEMEDGAPTFSYGDNSLTIGALAQFRCTADDFDQFDADPGDGVDEDADWLHEFRVQRMRVTLDGTMFFKWVHYKFQFEFGNTSGERDNKIKDALISLEASDAAVFDFGQYKVPFSLQELTSSGRLQFVDRAITNDKFAPGRDQGITMRGLFGDTDDEASPVFGYAVGAYNGAGESNTQDDDGFLYVARVFVNPFGEYKLSESAVENPERLLLHLGAAYRLGEAIQGTPDDVILNPNDQTAWNAEFALKYLGLFATGEYFRQTDEQERPVPGPDIDSDGWHAQLGYFIVPERFEVAARYAAIDPDDTLDNDDLTEWRAVVGYFLKKHNLKFQADYGEIEFDSNYGALSERALYGLPELEDRLVTGQVLTDKQFRAQLQLSF